VGSRRLLHAKVICHDTVYDSKVPQGTVRSNAPPISNFVRGETSAQNTPIYSRKFPAEFWPRPPQPEGRLGKTNHFLVSLTVLVQEQSAIALHGDRLTLGAAKALLGDGRDLIAEYNYPMTHPATLAPTMQRTLADAMAHIGRMSPLLGEILAAGNWN
jgi:hypothetical protein